MMPTLSSRLSVFISMILACFLAGCGGSNPSGISSGNSSYVKTINASVDDSASSPPPSLGTPFLINAKIGSAVAASNLEYGEATPAYATVGTGTNVGIQISFASLAGDPVPTTIAATLLKNQYYTVISTPGTAISTSGGAKPGAMVLQDDLTPPASGNIKIRLIHEALTAGPVDIYIVAPNAVIDDPKHPVTPTLSNFAVGAVSAYLQIPAGTYAFLVTPPGDPSDVISSNYFTSPLAAGDIYTAVFLDPHEDCYPGRACPALAVGYSMALTQDKPIPGVASSTASM